METNHTRKLHARHHFHSVGHGLFYSFDIVDHDNKNEKLLFVYDCGTKSGRHFLHSEIRSFQKMHGEKSPIHVLTLSKFNYEHFCGLMSLLEGREKGEMVFLPHVSENEKLFNYLTSYEARHDAKFLEFITDPASVLKQYFKTVSFVTKAQKPLMYNPNTVELGNSFLDLVSGPSENGMIDDNSYLRSNMGWIFYFYLSGPQIEKTEAISAALRKENLENLSFAKIVNDPILFQKAKAIYKDHSWNENETNLACIHGPTSLKYSFPTGFWYARRCCHILKFFFLKHRWLSLGGKDFCILTGSVNLSKHWSELRSKLEKIAQRISIFTLPHHGAHEHWNAEVMKDVDPDAWVVSSKILSLIWPGHKVLSDVKEESHGGEICKIHEFRNMAIQRIFILKP